VGFVDDQQGVLWQVVEQGRGWLPFLAAGQIARVVFYAAAVPDLLDHFQIETGTLLQSLCLHQLVIGPEVLDSVAELIADVLDDSEYAFPWGDVVCLGKYRVARDAARDFAGQRIENREVLDFVIEQLDAYCLLLGLRRKYVDHVATDAVSAALERGVVARVLQLRQSPHDVTLIDTVAPVEVEHHPKV